MIRLLKFIRNLFIFLLVSVLILTGLTCYARFIEPYNLKTSEIELRCERLKDGESLTIGVFSDTHFSAAYTTDDFESVIDAFAQMKPDVIVFTGDLIDFYNSYAAENDPDEISLQLQRLEAPLGKYAITGNHDYADNAVINIRGILENGGFTVLDNGSLVLPYGDFGNNTHFVLTGLDDYVIGHGEPSIVQNNISTDYNIVLCHEPDVADMMTGSEIDLMISGHTHAGQINIPLITAYALPKLGEKYKYGLFKFDENPDMNLYVTSGIGMTKLPLRFNARPEVAKITISK
ncbi:MAG: metallophosphoesterase [Clostridia bacterium]|nr:metallophosphoesterase [Clostridia bacterium]